MAGKRWVLHRQGAAHELWRCGSTTVAIPRHRYVSAYVVNRIHKDLERRAGGRLVAIGTERKTFMAHCVRGDDGWWGIDVEGLPEGGYTQARRLDQVEPMVRDLVSLLLELPDDGFDVTYDVQLPPGLDEAVASARSDLGSRLAAEERLATELPEVVARLRHAGLTVRDISALLGISFQRVSQLARPRPQR